MSVLFQVCLERFTAPSKGLFIKRAFMMPLQVFAIYSRFKFSFFFICCHFVAFHSLPLPFVLFHTGSEYPTVFNHAVGSGSLFPRLLLSAAKH